MRTTMLSVLLFFLAAASFAGEAEEGTTARTKCPVCGMFVAPYADWNAKVEFADSGSAIFDGSKDMFKYYLDIKKYAPARDKDMIKAITVKDYYSREDIDARKAYYVIWGDVYGPMGHEPIPFATEADAKKFLKEHHGKKILRFNDITLKLLHDLDNPD
jgi:nitrous oxide reductase accessory protein NosL